VLEHLLLLVCMSTLLHSSLTERDRDVLHIHTCNLCAVASPRLYANPYVQADCCCYCYCCCISVQSLTLLLPLTSNTIFTHNSKSSLVCMDQIDPAAIATSNYDTVLLITSTFGDGMCDTPLLKLHLLELVLLLSNRLIHSGINAQSG
jgi:hypothetical protein